MRIVLASIHPRLLSGQIEGLVGLAQALQNDGHQVQVVSAFPSQPLLSANRLGLDKPHRIFVDQPVRMTRILGQLVRLAPHADVIQLNLPTPAFSIYADLVQALVRVPVVVGYEAHLVNVRDLFRRSYWLHAPEFYLPRLLINNRVVSRITLYRAAHYIVHSQFQKKELIALGIPPERISRLPIILPRDKLTRPLHDETTPLPNGRLVTYVGHYNPVKGVDTLIRAFQDIASRSSDLRLVLAWSGIGWAHRVRQMIRGDDRIVELGHAHVPQLFGASTVVVLPYRLTIGQAAFPATLFEAIAANVPIVTSDLPLLRELTDDGATALLAPADDPVALAAAIERVLTDASLVQRMLAHQRRWMEQMLPERGIKEYERLYKQITERQAAILLSAKDRERV